MPVVAEISAVGNRHPDSQAQKLELKMLALKSPDWVNLWHEGIASKIQTIIK